MELDVTEAEEPIHDNGGTRSGQDRRKNKKKYHGLERRSGEDRRKIPDRRCGLTRRQTPDRRIKSPYWDGSRIERRDAFR
jgi:hypothetical protein